MRLQCCKCSLRTTICFNFFQSFVLSICPSLFTQVTWSCDAFGSSSWSFAGDANAPPVLALKSKIHGYLDEAIRPIGPIGETFGIGFEHEKTRDGSQESKDERW